MNKIIIIYKNYYKQEIVNDLQNNYLVEIFSYDKISNNLDLVKLCDVVILFDDTHNYELINKFQKLNKPIISISISYEELRFFTQNEYLLVDFKDDKLNALRYIINSLIRISHIDDLVFSLQVLIEHIDLPAIIIDENLKILASNTILLNNLKISYEDLVNQQITYLIEDKQVENFVKFIKSTQPFDIFNLIDSKKNLQDYKIKKSILEFSYRKLYLLTLEDNICTDIKNNNLINLLNNFFDPIRIMTIEGNVIYANKEFAKLFEIPLNSIIGKHFTEVYSTDYKNKIFLNNQFDFSKHNLQKKNINKVYIHNGKKKTLYARHDFIYLNNQKCILSVFRDITEQEFLKEQAKKKTDLLTLIFTLCTNIVYAKEKNFPHVIQSVVNLLGDFFEVDLFRLSILFEDKIKNFEYFGNEYEYFKDRVITNEINELNYKINEIIKYPDDTDRIPSSITRNFNEIDLKSVLIVPIIYSKQNIGSLQFYSFSNNYVWNNDEINILAIFSELIAGYITKTNYEILLQLERENLRSILNNLKEAIVIVDNELNILLSNQIFKEIFKNGHDHTNLLTLLKKSKAKYKLIDFIEYNEPEFYEFVQNHLNKTIEYIEVEINGENKYLTLSIYKYKTENNQYLISLIDNTEKVYLEIELATSQKLEAIGRLAAGIAHEINTPMQFINDNSNFLYDALSNIKQFFDDSGSLKENDIFKENYLKYDLDYFINEAINALNETFEGIERVKKIVIAMKEFAHPSSKEKVQTDLNKIIETTITISRNNWKYYADMITQFDTNLPLVECVIDEIGQVILNMIVNSAHAIEEKFKELNQKGYIKITTSADSSFAYITIEDNGTGIKPEHLSKIYEPFFTTKGVGKGTGQGLAIAYDIIVNKHNGDIKCESTYGEGTKFIIKLPLRSNNGKEV